MKQFYSKALALAGLTLSSLSASAQFATYRTWSDSSYVDININSGNPAFPFPQFKEYAAGKTLAAHNAEGVTHADMEKTMREAYEIMSHRCRYDGGTHCGVPYITFNNFRKFGDKEMPQGGAEFCTEGDGYMMLAAAIFADQATFNGLWMWIHDNRIPHRVRYQDGKVRLPNYKFGGGLPICYAMEGSTEENHGSATDGDDDIAMALLIAYKQWGEFMKQDGEVVKDFNGNPISYKKAAEDFIKAFVDTFSYTTLNGDGSIYNGGHMSGDIGIDGYVKGGSKGRELTYWRETQTTYPEISQYSIIAGGGGDGNTHTDYCAPAYYKEFAKWLESDDVEATDWQINQFKRAEASSDWLIGEAYKQGLIASLGNTKFDPKDDTKVSFDNFNEGEDFRTMWRMAQNYLWHGKPEYTWNPKTHQVEEGSNTNEYDMALRTAGIMQTPPSLKDPSEMWCSRLGASPDPAQPTFFGPSQIKMCYDKNGGVMSHYSANFTLGSAAPVVVLNEDLDLLADMYRQSELMWDDASAESTYLSEDERYIMSMPRYFQGWFRVLGLLVNSGNWHAPSNMAPAANMKVYMSVDKTFANAGEKIEYKVQYRNYGSADASKVQIETEIDPNYEVVSISNGGKFANGKIVWNVGTVPGFKSDHLAETMDSVSFCVVVRDTKNPRVALTSKISGDNFEEWVSNEYPNNATYTMERNIVDIVDNGVVADMKFDTLEAVPGDVVTATLSFVNNGQQWLNGGRDHVNLSYGNSTFDVFELMQFCRFWNDAHEAYINLGNYRLSYYMYDEEAIGLFDKEENPTGWDVGLDNTNDLLKYEWITESSTMNFLIQTLSNDSPSDRKCNQRLVFQFPNTLMATTTHLLDKLDSKYMIHKGGYGPDFFRMRLRTSHHRLLDELLDDDWSYDETLNIDRIDGQGEKFTLISPSYADNNDLGQEVTQYSRYSCDPLESKVFNKVLVEEYDGYTWRRILGEGIPTIGAENVVVADTIPVELDFAGWIDSTICGSIATFEPAADGASYTGVIKCEVPKYLNGTKDTLAYKLEVKDLKSTVAEKNVISKANVSTSTVENSKFSGSLKVKYELSKSKALANDAYNVYVENGELVVVFNDSKSHDLTITNALGSVSKYYGVSGTFKKSLPTSIYVVAVDGDAQKVVIK